MARTHAQQFANHTLVQAVLADPLKVVAPIAAGDLSGLEAIWEAAALDVSPIARVKAVGLTATLERHGLYTSVIVTPPAPRESGDPAAIMIVGRGDGSSRLSAVGCYVLSVAIDPKSFAMTFTLVSRNGQDEKSEVKVEGPLPDHRWLAEYAFALYSGTEPVRRDTTGEIPVLPGWYWWYALEAAGPMQQFAEARDEEERFAVVRRSPALLLPEIADAAEIYVGAKPAKKLRELRPYLRRDRSLEPTWQALVDKLCVTGGPSPGAHTSRALPIVQEAREHGAIPLAHGYELEAVVRCKLVALNIDPKENDAIARKLSIAARAAAADVDTAIQAPVATEDPMWIPLFLDETELQNCACTGIDESLAVHDPTFFSCAGLRAGSAVWTGDETSALAHVIDSRFVFRTPSAAARYLHEAGPLLADIFAPLPTPQIGDDTRAYGGEANGRRVQVLVLRVGRVIARLQVSEGGYAASQRQVLHAAMLNPLANRIVKRVREAQAHYWLAVAQPANTVAHLLHSPGYDAARLLDRCPMLAHAELPNAMLVLGDKYEPVARSLANFQAQLRAHRWQTYRGAMLALGRMLLETDVGDPFVNAAYAYEIAAEMANLDGDPVWMQLAADCQARG